LSVTEPHHEITPSSREELPALFALAEAAFAGMPGWDGSLVAEVLEEDVVFVARDRGLVGGYVALRHDDAGSLLVEQLLVAPGHEHRGVGRQLLAYAEGYAVAERLPSVRIVVEQSNHRARALYRRLGYLPGTAPEIVQRDLPYVE
jgi:ribosomal protein S18 acetylase RimI-like enzyme